MDVNLKCMMYNIYAFLNYVGLYEIEEHFWEESDL